MYPNRFICSNQIDMYRQGTHAFKLVESVGRKLRYTALSYRWGGEPEEETTVQNYDQRSQGHEPDKIPRLLADAIELTAACGPEYIWIDAICIVQNRDSNWEHKLSLLPEIYTNAIFTISASHADNVHQGLISEPATPVVAYNQLVQDRDPKHILVRTAPVHDPMGLQKSSDNATWPAFTRCWTFQERLLSKRVVHFAPEELIW